MKRFYLLPGKVACFKHPTEISTNLGTCVAICLFDSKTKIGGMNHYLLPEPKENQTASPRFGTNAVDELVKQMLALGASHTNLQAKVFGGGSVFKDLKVAKDIGEKNVLIAQKILARMNIPIIHQDVGGTEARKIRMHTDTFEVELVTQKKNASGDFDVAGYEQQDEPSKVTVAIVDDHPAIQKLYERIFKNHGLEVVGCASDAFEARKLIVQQKPMVITLDIEMPDMSGVDFLAKLMRHFPTPVVMVSHLDSCGDQAMRALELGAVEFVQKPTSLSRAELHGMAQLLVSKVKAAATKGIIAKKKKPAPLVTVPQIKVGEQHTQLIVVGGNTGSPQTLKDLLSKLPANLPPIVIANSTVTHFANHFIESLKLNSNLQIKIAQPKERLDSGIAYFVPKASEAKIVRVGEQLNLHLEAPQKPTQAPSADALFLSATRANNVVALLLSGYGEDGIAGLEALSARGHTVLVQSPDEAPLGHTPQRAIRQGLADFVVTQYEMVELLRSRSGKKAA